MFNEILHLLQHTTLECAVTCALYNCSQGPFDGVISFSQGAAFASLLCGVQEQNPGKTFNYIYMYTLSCNITLQCSLYEQPLSIIFSSLQRIHFYFPNVLFVWNFTLQKLPLTFFCLFQHNLFNRWSAVH